MNSSYPALSARHESSCISQAIDHDLDLAPDKSNPRNQVVHLAQIEENEDVAVRATELLEFIKRSEHEVIAVVTHKAFLRELERGPLKQWVQKYAQTQSGESYPLEFGNAEMRIYDLDWS